MKIAYLILAHNTPNHLKRLVKSLSSDSSSFFIHLDKKTSDKVFFDIEQEPGVAFVRERVPVFWGDFSLVEAVLNLLKTAFLSNIKFDRFVLLSGSDYPIRSAAYIEKFFQNDRGNEYINLVKMPAEEFGKPISRLTTYKLRPGDGKVINGVKKILMKTGIISRRDYKKYLIELTPYGGSAWWALTYEAVEYILNLTNERSQLVNFFKNTACPDEAFFQTILGNSSFKSRIKGNLTYTDWSEGGASPANISKKHLGIFASKPPFYADDIYGHREILFARKFTDDSEKLVSILEIQISGAEEQLTNRSA